MKISSSNTDYLSRFSSWKWKNNKYQEKKCREKSERECNLKTKSKSAQEKKKSNLKANHVFVQEQSEFRNWKKILSKYFSNWEKWRREEKKTFQALFILVFPFKFRVIFFLSVNSRFLTVSWFFLSTHKVEILHNNNNLLC